MSTHRPGETVYALHPKYRDGTRLRAGPAPEAGFNGVWVSNDTALVVLAVAKGFAEVWRNVIVTRTISKAFCLAALRCGYLVAHPTTVERLRSWHNPKGVNELARIAAALVEAMGSP